MWDANVVSKRPTRKVTVCYRCKGEKPSTSTPYCRPCANAYYLEQKAKKGRRTYPPECYRCGATKSIYHSFCGPCRWKNTRKNKPVGYPACVDCGAAKNPTTFRYCTDCGRKRVEDRKARLGYIRKKVVCVKCGAPIATENQSYCLPCARQRDREKRIEDPGVNRAKVNRRRARLHSANGSFTKEEWRALIKCYKSRCAYCGIKSKSLTADHVIPLSAGGCNFIYNIRPACRSCNAKKHAKMPSEVHFSLFDQIE
jgi:hypothetical protein